MTSYLIIQGEDTSIYLLIKIQGVAWYRRYQFSKHINFFTAERPRFKTRINDILSSICDGLQTYSRVLGIQSRCVLISTPTLSMNQ